MTATEIVGQKFNLAAMTWELAHGGSVLETVIRGSHGRYIGPVFCGFLGLTPKQLGVVGYVGKGKENTPVDYVVLMDEHNLDAEIFDPFINHFGILEDIEKELTKSLGTEVRFDVLEADNSVVIRKA